MMWLYSLIAGAKRFFWPILKPLENMLDISRYDGEILLLSGHDSKLKKLMGQYEQTNYKLYIFTLLLCAYGMLILYSATCAMGINKFSDPFYFVIRQAIFMLMGIIAMYLLERINYQILYSRIVWIIYVLSNAFVLLLKTSLGSGANGAIRAIEIGGFSFSPAEVVKVAVILVLAYMAQKYRKTSSIFLIVYMYVLGAIPAGLVFWCAKDLSSAIVIAAITFGICVVVTRQLWVHALLAAGAGVGAYMWVQGILSNMPPVSEALNFGHRVQRIIAWVAPEIYYDNVGYQVANTMYICAAGGWFGKGLGTFQSVSSLVPYAYTDMIFGVILYELGICGVCVMFILFIALLLQVYRTLINAEDIFGSIIGLGILIHLSVQVIIHTCVVLNIFPNTGQTLPWISYGGSTVLCQSLEIGLLLSIVRLHHMRYAKSELAGHSYIE